AKTHFSDDLRSELRRLSDQLANEEQALVDLDDRILQERALRSEIISTKFKLSRLEAASTVLEDVHFELCPQCGADVGMRTLGGANCSLCGTPNDVVREAGRFSATTSQSDLDSRLVDIEASLKERERARRRQQITVSQLAARKSQLDMEFSREMSTYDSAFLSQIRALERSVAALEQKLLTLE